MNTSRHFETISQALYWLVENQQEQPTLKQMSHHFKISEFHLQKTFQELAGVSPKQFLKHLGKEAAIDRLKNGQSVLDTAIDVGLSGPGRLHDLLVTTEAVTPGEVRHSQQTLVMNYGFGLTPFGDALIAWTSRGISFLGFCHQLGREKTLAGLRNQWPDVELLERPEQAGSYLRNVFENENNVELDIWLRGSPFQLKVWEALLRIPFASHCTYGQIAESLGNPGASRAVGTAIGKNPISWLIPCHRVITSLGTLGGYRWGVETKQAMNAIEASKARKIA